jgi:hypothetical protein
MCFCRNTILCNTRDIIFRCIRNQGKLHLSEYLEKGEGSKKGNSLERRDFCPSQVKSMKLRCVMMRFLFCTLNKENKPSSKLLFV